MSADKEDNPVLRFSLYKNDPNCVDYHFEVHCEYENDDPRTLEQFNIAKDVIGRYMEECEKALIHKALMADRNLRKAMKAQFENFEQVPPEKVH